MVTMQPVLLYSQAPAMLFEKKNKKKHVKMLKYLWLHFLQVQTFYVKEVVANLVRM